MKIKLDQRLKWLWPYLESVSYLIPIEKLVEIKLSFYTSHTSYYGLCENMGRNRFKITLKLRKTIKKQRVLEHWIQDDVLYYLAHELSHLVHWEHTTERLMLESIIYHHFAMVVNRIGYEEKRNEVR